MTPLLTKTLLSVMINSVGGKNRDMVAMIPSVNLKAEKISEIYKKVLKGVTDIGFSTCASGVDSNRINKKFYKELFDGKKVHRYQIHSSQRKKSSHCMIQPISSRGRGFTENRKTALLKTENRKLIFE